MIEQEIKLGSQYPYDKNAEVSLIAALILEPYNIPGVQGILAPECFYYLSHQILYHEIIDMHNNKQPIDLVTLKDRLLAGGLLDKVGGIENLVIIIGSVPTASNSEYYAKIIQGHYTRRRIINNASEILRVVSTASIWEIRQLYKTGDEILIESCGQYEIQCRLKIIIEHDFISHLIRSHKNDVSKINEKLTPAHFSDLVCQCLYKMIIDKFNNGKDFSLPCLVDYNKKDFGLGFIGIEGLIDFFKDEPQTSINLIDYAEKIIIANNRLAELSKKEGN